jgi:N utilization substance protein B
MSQTSRNYMSQTSRKKTRKFLLQKLYARIYGELDEIRFQEAFFDGILDFTLDEPYVKEMFPLVIEHQNDILGIIKKYAPKFDVDTMLKTNILALSIAITEMLWLPEEIPAKVSINEAIDLAKYYGDDTSKNIVNGILNSFFLHIKSHSDTNEITQEKYHFFT